MRLLAAFLLIAALAVGFALLARSDVGYVQFTLPPMRVEMSFFVFVLATLAAFFALYGVLRLAARIAAMPRSGGLPALIGARAAIDMRDFEGAAALLARSDARVPSLDVPRLMLEAEL